MSRRAPGRLLRTGLHIGTIAAVVAFVAVVASAWTTPFGKPVPRVSADEGIFLQIGSGGGSFVFSPIMCDQANISPLSQCFTSVTISNVGESDSSPAIYSIVAWADDDGVDSGAPGPAGDLLISCFNVNLLLGTADGVNVGNSSSDGPLPGAVLQLGESQTWGIEASVDGDNACFGTTTSLIVSVTALWNEDDLPDADPGPGGDFDNPPENGANSNTNSSGPDGGGPETTSLTSDVLGVQSVQTISQTPPTIPSSQTTQAVPVNEIAGVQRLPGTGSGGFLDASGFHAGGLTGALLVLLLGVILAGSGLILTLRKRA